MRTLIHVLAGVPLCLFMMLVVIQTVEAQTISFKDSTLNFNGQGGVTQGTSLMFGPDGRLYVINIDGSIDIFSIQKNGPAAYSVISSEKLLDVKNIPNHNDDGSSHTGTSREATGITVVGTPTQPVIYASSSDARVGGPGGDDNLDTNSGVITRLTWNGSSWDVVDIVRGLPRSEENHATNGLEFVTIGTTDYLIVCSGGHTNAGSPSDNFAWTTEYALSAAVLSIDLTALEGISIKTDASLGRQYIYDIPTVDDPTRSNVNGIDDPNTNGYNGIDIGDPWGGNDGLNQAMIVTGGPVQIFSPGFRNTFDLALTQDGKVYVTDNGANPGWGGLPENEGLDFPSKVTNNYIFGEPGSASPVGGEAVNNQDHLTLITDNIQNYTFGSFYGGHPAPIRANPDSAGLFTNPLSNEYDSTLQQFRTQLYDPDGSTPGSTTDPNIGLPANWPPVPVADAIQGDWRGPGINNPDGPNDDLITIWGTNTNGLDEYTASTFNGAMQGDLIAGKNGGVLRRVELNADGSLENLTNTFASNLGGNALGITCNGDDDPFPGTIWVATFNGNIVVLEPEVVNCILPGDQGYDANDDTDSDGYSNQDEIDNKDDIETVEEVICNSGNQPDDFDKSAGSPLVSNLNDADDDNDGINDANDVMQIGDPTDGGSDAFVLPVINELLSDNLELNGYLGLGFTGLMNNGDANPNWLDWLDRRFDPNDPNPNDILGGAVGAMTMQMTSGTALGNANSQEKAFQYGVEVDQSTGVFTVEAQLLNFTDPLQLYGNQAPVAGELGVFIGDGTQSNYIKFVINQSGLQVLQEINDIPQTPIDLGIVTANRPSNNVTFRFLINPSSGEITLTYVLDNSAFQSMPSTITAQGSILNAVQNSNSPLIVGLIGSSNTNGAEVEGTWNYLNVQGSQPIVSEIIDDIDRFIGATPEMLDLNDYFDDDNGDGNLTYSIQQHTNTAIGAIISSNILTLTYPTSSEASSDITIRATDNDNLFIDQSFTVNVLDEPIPILRIRANGGTLLATDSPNPDWIGITAGGAQSGTSNTLTYAVNTGSLSTQGVNSLDASVPSYAPIALYDNERFDPTTGPEMLWSFGLPNGNYLVRLYMGNGFGGTSEAGERVFDISIEGVIVEDDLDLSSEFNHKVGGMKEHFVSLTDGNLNILFEHVVENPLVNAIEILSIGGSIPIAVESIDPQSNFEGDLVNITVMPSGGDPNENFTFSAIDLPDGIQIEPTTGLIFGNVAAAAATNSPYASMITVNKPSSDPVILNIPWNVSGPVADAWTNQTDDEMHTARHECSFVQAGDKFFLFGGRENPDDLDVYDFQNKTWFTIQNSAPEDFNHFQALEYKGLIWVIGAFKNNNFPNETPADYVWAYNPAADTWIQGPEIPANRKRGSAALVEYNDKLYVICGNTIGHNGGYQAWFDEFDPSTGIWTPLVDAPRARDHFHATILDDKLYVAGGRLSGGPLGVFAPLIAEVDVYDFTTGTWSTLPAGKNLPTPRAAASVTTFENKVWVIGGEIEDDLQGNTINDAVKTTEAYNPATTLWETKADLITERHGTQAIVSGNGIHITAGSSTKGGGGTMKNMEFYGEDNASGTPLATGLLTAVDVLNIPPGGTALLNLTNSTGNVGVIINDIEISGLDFGEFGLTSSSEFLLICPGETTDLTIQHLGTEEGKSAVLTLTYDGDQTKIVALNTAIAEENILYRVNTGGALVAALDAPNPDWTGDVGDIDAAGNSPYLTSNSSGGSVFTQAAGSAFQGPVNMSHPSLPANTPASIFIAERYDPSPELPDLKYQFPVSPGAQIEVRLYFAELFGDIDAAGQRVFSVLIEGAQPPNLANIDPYGTTGPLGGFMLSHTTAAADGLLDIEFVHNIENPAIKAIEVIEVGGTENSSPMAIIPETQNNIEGESIDLQIVATDATPCTGLTYRAENLPTGLTIDSTNGMVSGTITAPVEGSSGSFIEENGLVIIEAETDFVETAGGWNLEVGTPSFLVASTNHFNNTGGQNLSYDIDIATPGVYRLQMKSEFQGDDATEENDTWFRIANSASVHFFCVEGGALSNTAEFEFILGNGTTTKSIYYPAGNSQGRPDHGNENPGNSGYFKIFRSGGGANKWDAKTIDNNGFPVYAYFPTSGSYTIEMSERSAGHKVDRFALTHIDDVGAGIPTAILNGPESQQNTTGDLPGAADNSPYAVVITIEDGCVPSLSDTIAFDWIVTSIDDNTQASLKVNPGGDLFISTFGNNSFQIENTGTVDITSISIDASSSFLPDIVFDPVGKAGDNAAKCVTQGTAGIGDVGVTIPANGGTDASDCVDPFSQPHNGVDDEEGYDIITLNFTDFNPGEVFAFGVDMDPTTIKGDLSSGDAGSVSGFELIGSSVEVEFSNGLSYTNDLWDEGSLGGSETSIGLFSTDSFPSISFIGLNNPSLVDTLGQNLIIQGPPNAEVEILHIDSRLHIDPGNPTVGFDIDPFEANEAIAKMNYTVVLDSFGVDTLPIQLMQTTSTDAGPDGGINHFIASIVSPFGSSRTSNVLTVEFSDAPMSSLDIAAELQSRIHYHGAYSVLFFDPAADIQIDSPVDSFMLIADSSGSFTVSGMAPGFYDVVIDAPHFLGRRIDSFELVDGVNTLNLLIAEGNELRAGDASDNEFVSIQDFGILVTTFNKVSSDTSFNAAADFNADGFVSIQDFGILVTNFNTIGPYPYQEQTARNRDPAITGGPEVFFQAVNTWQKGVWNTLDIYVDATDKNVDGLQVDIEYDPTLLEIAQFNLADNFEQHLHKYLDIDKGEIQFGIGSMKAAVNTLVKVATLKLRPISTGNIVLHFSDLDRFKSMAVLGDHTYESIWKDYQIQIAGEKLEGWSFWPNPSTGNLTIEHAVADESANFRLFDTQGKLIYERALNSGQSTTLIELPTVPDGVYIGQFEHGNYRNQKKIIISQP